MSVTIEDISQHLGVSVSTVSKALNGYQDVALRTRERVQTAALEMGYHPNTAARNLRRQRTDKIGFVFNNALSYINDYFAEIIVGASTAAEANGNNIILYTNEGDSLDGLLNLCRKREVDGFVLVWNHVSVDMIGTLLAERVPFVVLGRRVNHPQASYIAPDNYNGALALMAHLTEQGHRRIGFMARPSMKMTHVDRLQGYLDGLENAGISPDPTLISTTQIEPHSGYHATHTLLDLDNPPTAIFAFHDMLAIDALTAIQERGLRVPQDIALAGFDGLRASLITTPTITTVKQPLEQIGQRSIEILLTRIAQPNQLPIQETLPVELVVRASTQI